MPAVLAGGNAAPLNSTLGLFMCSRLATHAQLTAQAVLKPLLAHPVIWLFGAGFLLGGLLISASALWQAAMLSFASLLWSVAFGAYMSIAGLLLLLRKPQAKSVFCSFFTLQALLIIPLKGFSGLSIIETLITFAFAATAFALLSNEASKRYFSGL